MKILVSGTKPELASPELAPYVGHLTSPATGTRFGHFSETGLVWAADNDAFSKGGFDREAYLRMLDRIRDDAPPGLIFVTAPDVPGSGYATLGLFDWWLNYLADADEALDLPAALVGQDGMEDCNWDEMLPYCAAFFIGGTTEWKESKAAADLAREAKRRGKWVHMGRVNTKRRLRIAYDLGCDSVDGTSFSWFTEKRLVPAVNYLKTLHRRPPAGWSGRLRQAVLF